MFRVREKKKSTVQTLLFFNYPQLIGIAWAFSPKCGAAAASGNFSTWYTRVRFASHHIPGTEHGRGCRSRCLRETNRPLNALHPNFRETRLRPRGAHRRSQVSITPEHPPKLIRYKPLLRRATHVTFACRPQNMSHRIVRSDGTGT